MSIYVENLCKRFEYYKKEEGLKGSFKNIFRRKKLIKHAVDGISFSVPQGEILALLGPNGADIGDGAGGRFYPMGAENGV